jgi:phage gpG-like protein
MSVTTNAGEVIAVMNGMLGRMRDTRPVLERIGEHQASRVMLSIMSEKDDPEDHPWAEWMPATRTQRERKGNAGLGLLWDRGDLLASIGVNVKRNELQIGTSAKHAPYLQHGTRRMAARPFLGWGKQDAEVAERWLVQYIAGALL